jgi:hypothetical protein
LVVKKAGLPGETQVGPSAFIGVRRFNDTCQICTSQVETVSTTADSQARFMVALSRHLRVLFASKGNWRSALIGGWSAGSGSVRPNQAAQFLGAGFSDSWREVRHRVQHARISCK